MSHRVGWPLFIITLVCCLTSVTLAAQQKVVLEYYTWGSDIQTIENEQYLFSYFTNAIRTLRSKSVPLVA